MLLREESSLGLLSYRQFSGKQTGQSVQVPKGECLGPREMFAKNERNIQNEQMAGTGLGRETMVGNRMGK